MEVSCPSYKSSFRAPTSLINLKIQSFPSRAAISSIPTHRRRAIRLSASGVVGPRCCHASVRAAAAAAECKSCAAPDLMEMEEWNEMLKWGDKCSGSSSGVVELLECLEREAIMGEDQGRDPVDYNRRAQIFDKSSRVFQALKQQEAADEVEENVSNQT